MVSAGTAKKQTSEQRLRTALVSSLAESVAVVPSQRPEFTAIRFIEKMQEYGKEGIFDVARISIPKSPENEYFNQLVYDVVPDELWTDTFTAINKHAHIMLIPLREILDQVFRESQN